MTLHGMTLLRGRWVLCEVKLPVAEVKQLVSGSGPEIRDALRRKVTNSMGGTNARSRAVILDV